MRHFCFWTSILCWTLAALLLWIVRDAPGTANGYFYAFCLMCIGGFTGTIWLVLKVLQLAARYWHQEKARAAHN